MSKYFDTLLPETGHFLLFCMAGMSLHRFAANAGIKYDSSGHAGADTCGFIGREDSLARGDNPLSDITELLLLLRSEECTI